MELIGYDHQCQSTRSNSELKKTRGTGAQRTCMVVAFGGTVLALPSERHRLSIVEGEAFTELQSERPVRCPEQIVHLVVARA